MALHSGREKRMTAKKMRLLQEALRSLKKFDHQDTNPSPSSASSTAEIIYTPEESLSGDMEVRDASPRMLAPIPTRRGKGEW
ncbi:hypothetical protein CGCA056_v001744 [Colletotrichum aenigma]|uniref:uncharacterized protein n=1 Tax=Colletotrichum aenigma TaxID=1215731 RepID=UPI001872B7BC|nr:uncharacterized protein CGCA056_v001744 [Colletotrichum aenigma]KAF5528473.1 hypothetical protein CGCA056_v001744 [Colletotrichum aenigma]